MLSSVGPAAASTLTGISCGRAPVATTHQEPHMLHTAAARQCVRTNTHLQQCYRLWIGKARQGRAGHPHSHRQLFWSNQPAATSISDTKPCPCQTYCSKIHRHKNLQTFHLCCVLANNIMVSATIITAKKMLNYQVSVRKDEGVIKQSRPSLISKQDL